VRYGRNRRVEASALARFIEEHRADATCEVLLGRSERL
jgi:hypothetical protein